MADAMTTYFRGDEFDQEPDNDETTPKRCRCGHTSRDHREDGLCEACLACPGFKTLDTPRESVVPPGMTAQAVRAFYMAELIEHIKTAWPEFPSVQSVGIQVLLDILDGHTAHRIWSPGGRASIWTEVADAMLEAVITAA